MSSGISVTVKERRSIKGLSRTTLLPQFYIKRVAIPTHSVKNDVEIMQTSASQKS